MTIIETKAWVKGGANSYAAHCVAPAGYELKTTGYRLRRADGSTFMPGFPPFKTRAEAEAKLAEVS